MPVCSQSSFLKKFEEPLIFKEADSTQGKPTLITANLKDSPVIIKYWPHESHGPSDILEDIWLYEIRQLRRLKGYPGLGDYIANLIDAGKDECGFYLVLDAGNRLPLSNFLQSSMQKKTLSIHWLKTLKVPQRRIRFWNNIIRVINALQLLHSQGLLHRHLDEDAILTDPHSSDSDFQLTGFEWSIRVQTMSGFNTSGSPSESIKSGRVYSFLTDWADLGRLIAKILKLDILTLRNLTIPIKQLVDESGLTLDEITLIRGLLGDLKLQANIPRESIDGNMIITQVKDIITSLTSLLSSDDSNLDIIIHLNTNTPRNLTPLKKSSVFIAIQHIYKKLYDVNLGENDTSECIKFVASDLRNDPRIVILPSPEGENEELLLLGSHLTYILTKHQRKHGEANWDAAFCHSAYIDPPKELRSNCELAKLSHYTFHYYTPSQYRTKQQSSSRSWDDVIISLHKNQEEDINKQKIIDGFSAYHLTEIAYAKSEIYPVSLVSFEKNKDDYSLYNVILKNTQDHDVQAISRSLGLKSPAKRVDEKLKSETSDSFSWILVSNANFIDEEEIVLEFQKIDSQPDGESFYCFTTTSSPPDYNKYYIIPLSVQGTTSQLNRRASAIDALSNHAELIGMLSNPYSGSTLLQEGWEKHKAFDSLDFSKQEAFINVIKTLPLYLVQGPPGVGKTFLVTALMQQIFSQETESRVLLTAQGHSTVQHLYHEVMNYLNNSVDTKNPPLIVSCIKTKGQNNSESDSLAELDLQIQSYLKLLIESSFFQKIKSNSAKEKIIAMSDDSARSSRNPLASQLLKAANIVFTTTNSRQVEELINARSQFDWSIMEETGKVTGIELLSPLLLSYRRLMIGDHKQLPPYAAKEMKKILEDPKRLHNALKIGTDVYNNSLKGQIIKSRFTDEFVQSLNEEQLNNLCKDSLRLHLLFENLIFEEEKTLEKSIKHFGSDIHHQPIASMLSIQHRMHPNIAALISRVFYNEKLYTEKNKTEFYLQTPSQRPFIFREIDSASTEPAIIWIETPDRQSNRHCKAGESYPRWQNKYECNIIMTLLSKLSVSTQIEKKPKLAILSPYTQQVRLLSKEIEKKTAREELANLSKFDRPDDHMSFCSTVDSFQGAEADLVIVSLVRNNHHSYGITALGFLLDSQRMNVLLSRAKYQMILVGSLQFLHHWAKKIKKEQVDKGNHSHAFIVKLVDTLMEYKTQGIMKCIPAEILLPDTSKINLSISPKKVKKNKKGLRS
ncbi:hypothetical protein FE394_01200 [Xenorhabdus sp. Reich]|uniref:Protein kinase domain-containing protein n=1 Tax=Xenorhabdus littoralis TaxID=2582835 RepID=A0ABU4SGS7_9GAMM|nr:AAA domain-containing protein [Xenorhabdus sp. Reich]MDX7997847.1 hypothetical protein [Xenorhabdus sp. Reich]